MDTNLPKFTNRDTAELIKEKIEHCNRFFLATYRGLRSKWCDWELGIAYSIKKVNELALLPVESRTGRWAGSEYLNLYPIMIIGDDLDNLKAEEVFVNGPADKLSVSLEVWLHN